MMTIEKIGSKEVERVSLQEGDFVSADFQEQDQHSLQAARALHQVFNQDILEGPATAAIVETVEAENLLPSFWEKLFFWRKKSEKASIPSVTKQAEIAIPSALSPVPVLEPPDHIPEDLQAAKLPPVSKKGNVRNSLTPSEIREGLAQMSEQSIDAILFIIFHAQLEWEKEHAQGAEKTFSKYLECQKLQEKVLQEIKDVLAKDETTAKRFNTAQSLAFAASALSGLLATAAKFEFLNNFRFFRNHPKLMTISSVCSAGFSGLTMAAKTYFQRRSSEHRATHAEYEHRNHRFNALIRDARERFMTIAEADNAFKERWAQHLKRIGKMNKMAFKK